MRKRMYQNVLVNHFHDHSSVYLFVMVLFLMGIIFGAIVVNSLSFSQKEDLLNYLSRFFGEFSHGRVAASQDLFFQSFFHNIKFIGLMWILGISVIGLPLILILLFIKGLVVGFTVGFLVNQMGWNGFILSFVSVLPQNLIIIPIFIIGAAMSVSFSLAMIQRQFMKKMSRSFTPIIGRYLVMFMVTVVFLVAAAGIEAFVSPALMKLVVNSVL